MPVSAVLKRAGVERKIRRPKGWRGSKSTSWLEPEQAFAVIDQAYRIEPEFGLFCKTLLYTGMRLGDITSARLRGLKLNQALLYLPDTKNGDPRPVHLPPVLVKAFRDQPARPARPRKTTGTPLPNGAAGQSRRDAGILFLDRHPDQKLFRFAISGHLRDMLKLAMQRAGLTFPRRQGGFHLFCHTYGTWMAHYGKLDTYGLTRTGRWKDPDSADRYNHTAASPEARRADLLPVPKVGPTLARKRPRG
jgi:integrase